MLLLYLASWSAVDRDFNLEVLGVGFVFVEGIRRGSVRQVALLLVQKGMIYSERCCNVKDMRLEFLVHFFFVDFGPVNLGLPLLFPDTLPSS